VKTDLGNIRALTGLLLVVLMLGGACKQETYEMNRSTPASKRQAQVAPGVGTVGGVVDESAPAKLLLDVSSKLIQDGQPIQFFITVYNAKGTAITQSGLNAGIYQVVDVGTSERWTSIRDISLSDARVLQTFHKPDKAGRYCFRAQLSTGGFPESNKVCVDFKIVAQNNSPPVSNPPEINPVPPQQDTKNKPAYLEFGAISVDAQNKITVKAVFKNEQGSVITTLDGSKTVTLYSSLNYSLSPEKPCGIGTTLNLSEKQTIEDNTGTRTFNAIPASFDGGASSSKYCFKLSSSGVNPAYNEYTIIKATIPPQPPTNQPTITLKYSTDTGGSSVVTSASGLINNSFNLWANITGYNKITSCTISPLLPSGLTINPSSCHIYGTPTELSSKKTYTVTLVDEISTSTTRTAKTNLDLEVTGPVTPPAPPLVKKNLPITVSPLKVERIPASDRIANNDLIKITAIWSYNSPLPSGVTVEWRSTDEGGSSLGYSNSDGKTVTLGNPQKITGAQATFDAVTFEFYSANTIYAVIRADGYNDFKTGLAGTPTTTSTPAPQLTADQQAVLAFTGSQACCPKDTMCNCEVQLIMDMLGSNFMAIPIGSIVQNPPPVTDAPVTPPAPACGSSDDSEACCTAVNGRWEYYDEYCDE
jgi:hypothetical protein